MPMYFAGRLESQNSVEYEDAAGIAKERARVELEHEVFFRETVAGHRLLPVMKKVFGWS